MKKTKKSFKGFTLVELIVVIAIIAILSTVGFVSYNGYIRDARNSQRNSQTAQIVSLIAQFVANNGRTPSCNTGDVCSFCKHGVVATCTAGIATDDWDLLNVTQDPKDPKVNNATDGPVYYLYATDASKSEYQIAATEETSSSTNPYKATVKGSKDATIPGNNLYTSGTVTPAGVACTNMVHGSTACIPYVW